MYEKPRDRIFQCFDQRVTIYGGCQKLDAHNVTIDRSQDPLNNHEDRVTFKQKYYRNFRYYLQRDAEGTVILKGWGYQQFNSWSRLKAGLPPLPPPPGPPVDDGLSFTIMAGVGRLPTKDYIWFNIFMADVDPTLILYDTRDFRKANYKI